MDVFSYHLSQGEAVPAGHVDATCGHTGVAPGPGVHLPLLKKRFPGASWLTVPQIAACLKLSAGHLYNLHSTNRVPFKLSKNPSGRLRASVQDVAAYMDREWALVHSGQPLARGPRRRWARLPAQA